MLSGIMSVHHLPAVVYALPSIIHWLFNEQRTTKPQIKNIIAKLTLMTVSIYATTMLLSLVDAIIRGQLNIDHLTHQFVIQPYQTCKF